MRMVELIYTTCIWSLIIEVTEDNKYRSKLNNVNINYNNSNTVNKSRLKAVESPIRNCLKIKD